MMGTDMNSCVGSWLRRHNLISIMGRFSLPSALCCGVFLLAHPIGRVATESGTITQRDPDTVRGPDVSFYSIERMPLGQRINRFPDIAADLCVEVLSPSNSKSDIATKIIEYFTADVRMVWVVDPDHRSVTVYRSAADATWLNEADTLDGGDILPGFTCKVADLFASIGG